MLIVAILLLLSLSDCSSYNPYGSPPSPASNQYISNPSFGNSGQQYANTYPPISSYGSYGLPPPPSPWTSGNDPASNYRQPLLPPLGSSSLPPPPPPYSNTGPSMYPPPPPPPPMAYGGNTGGSGGQMMPAHLSQNDMGTNIATPQASISIQPPIIPKNLLNKPPAANGGSASFDQEKFKVALSNLLDSLSGVNQQSTGGDNAVGMGLGGSSVVPPSPLPPPSTSQLLPAMQSKAPANATDRDTICFPADSPIVNTFRRTLDPIAMQSQGQSPSVLCYRVADLRERHVVV